MELDDLKTLIIHKLDTTDFMDILGWDLSDLVDKLEEEILENKEAFEEATR